MTDVAPRVCERLLNEVRRAIFRAQFTGPQAPDAAEQHRAKRVEDLSQRFPISLYCLPQTVLNRMSWQSRIWHENPAVFGFGIDRCRCAISERGTRKSTFIPYI